MRATACTRRGCAAQPDRGSGQCRAPARAGAARTSHTIPAMTETADLAVSAPSFPHSGLWSGRSGPCRALVQGKCRSAPPAGRLGRTAGAPAHQLRTRKALSGRELRVRAGRPAQEGRTNGGAGATPRAAEAPAAGVRTVLRRSPGSGPCLGRGSRRDAVWCHYTARRLAASTAVSESNVTAPSLVNSSCSPRTNTSPYSRNRSGIVQCTAFVDPEHVALEFRSVAAPTVNRFCSPRA